MAPLVLPAGVRLACFRRGTFRGWLGTDDDRGEWQDLEDTSQQQADHGEEARNHGLLGMQFLLHGQADNQGQEQTGKQDLDR